MQTQHRAEPRHLAGRGANNYTIHSTTLQALQAEFNGAHGPSPWFREFDAYMAANELRASLVGQLVVHEQIDGVATFLGFDGWDRVVLGYGKQRQRKFRADNATLALLSLATQKQIASATLDGVLPNAPDELSQYRSGLAKKRARLESELSREQEDRYTALPSGEEEIGGVQDGYALRKRPGIDISVEQLIDLTEAS